MTRLSPMRKARGGPAPDAASGSRDAELLAWLLDESIPIPGTGRRIGVDAIIGLVPGLGDVTSGALSVLIIARAAQARVPRIVLARMLLNLGLDLTIGAVPVLGDAFDLFWKANSRNVRLLRRYAGTSGGSTRGSWAVIIAVVAVGLGMVLLVAWAIIWLIAQLATISIGGTGSLAAV
jgi:hypothetical protein